MNKTKLQIFNAVMVPIISHGMESLALHEKHFSKITAVEMRYMRRMVGKNRIDRIKNERIIEEVVQRKAMVNTIEEQQLRLFGYVRRMGEDRKAKQVYEMRVY